MKGIKSPTVIVGFIIMLSVGWILGSQEREAHAQNFRTVPKSWGTCKGSVGFSLIFEDSTGTIHLVFPDGKTKTIERE